MANEFVLSPAQAKALRALKDHGTQYPSSEGWLYATSLDVTPQTRRSLRERGLAEDRNFPSPNAEYRITKKGLEALEKFEEGKGGQG